MSSSFDCSRQENDDIAGGAISQYHQQQQRHSAISPSRNGRHRHQHQREEGGPSSTMAASNDTSNTPPTNDHDDQLLGFCLDLDLDIALDTARQMGRDDSFASTSCQPRHFDNYSDPGNIDADSDATSVPLIASQLKHAIFHAGLTPPAPLTPSSKPESNEQNTEQSERVDSRNEELTINSTSFPSIATTSKKRGENACNNPVSIGASRSNSNSQTPAPSAVLNEITPQRHLFNAQTEYELPDRNMIRRVSETSVTFPSDYRLGGYDIICGRHKAAFNHFGNKRFRVTVSIFLETYLKLDTRTKRSCLILDIVDTVEGAGGNFLKFDSRFDRWEKLVDKEARNKVGHALRDAASKEAASKRNKRR